jgi:scaffold protein FimL
MTAPSAAAKANSFELVQSEIETTINQAEKNLEHFQENRESGEDLQNCIDFLNQLRGIFVLVEIQGGVMLCHEAVSLANEVPVGATDDKNNLLTTLNNALFMLRRYVEYYQQRREDHPELLLPIINELRQAIKNKPYPDSHFFDVDMSRTVDHCQDLGVNKSSEVTDFDHRARRLRHMYQVALLGVIRDQNLSVSLKLLTRSALGMSKLCGNSPLSGLWCLLTVASQAMIDRQMEVTLPRKRLLMKVERYTKELVYVGKVVTSKTAPDSIIKELVYMLSLSGSPNQEVIDILNGYGVAPQEFNEQKLISHRKRLFGPGADVLRSLSGALQEEISQLKDKLDIIERGIDPDVTDFSVISAGLEKLISTLIMLDLKQLAELATHQNKAIKSWSDSGRVPTEEDLISVANAVLTIEQAIKRFEETGITPELDDSVINQQGVGNSPYLSEAMIVVTDEAQSGITLTKRAITAFVESNWDKLHLANISATLNGVRGSMVMVGESRLAAALAASTECITKELFERETRPDEKVLETLADTLTSLEYYIETIAGREAVNADLLLLAEESLKSINYPAA